MLCVCVRFEVSDRCCVCVSGLRQLTDDVCVCVRFEVPDRCSVCVSGFPTISCSAIVDLTKETSELDKLRKRLVDIVEE